MPLEQSSRVMIPGVLKAAGLERGRSGSVEMCMCGTAILQHTAWIL